MKKSGLYFTLERPRNRKPMEPKRVLHKVRIWNGTPTQKFFGNKKGKVKNFFDPIFFTIFIWYGNLSNINTYTYILFMDYG